MSEDLLDFVPTQNVMLLYTNLYDLNETIPVFICDLWLGATVGDINQLDIVKKKKAIQNKTLKKIQSQ